MRPPEGLKDWFDKMEEEQLSMLDQPGGWNTRSRRYRIVFAVVMTLILVAEVVVLASVISDDIAGLVVGVIITIPLVVWLWVLAVNPTRAVRLSNWRGRRKPPSS